MRWNKSQFTSLRVFRKRETHGYGGRVNSGATTGRVYGVIVFNYRRHVYDIKKTTTVYQREPPTFYRYYKKPFFDASNTLRLLREINYFLRSKNPSSPSQRGEILNYVSRNINLGVYVKIGI